MNVWIFSALAIVLLAVLLIPVSGRERPKRKKSYPASGAVLFGINEVFQPTAANASIILGEQRESRKALPSPEDKPLS
jgi:hypothetical protein